MTTRDNFLHIYLRDHLAAATGGTALARRLAKNHRGTWAGAQLAQLAHEVEQDCESLMAVMSAVGARPDPIKRLAALAAERLGRLKLNGELLRRSPLSSLVELEAMRLAVEAKAAAWRTLRELAENDERLDGARLDELVQRAENQVTRLESMRTRAVRDALQSS